MSGDLSGFSLFELFKAEAESHSASLSDGLLAIEANPEDLSHVEELMRAAHSLKGAARIVGLDAVVDLAHAMEDCFVAVQKGEEQLSSARVDQLLRGVDVFQALSTLPEQQWEAWRETNGPSCQELSSALRRVAQSSTPPASETTTAAHDTPAEPEAVSEADTKPPSDKAAEPPRTVDATPPEPVAAATDAVASRPSAGPATPSPVTAPAAPAAGPSSAVAEPAPSEAASPAETATEDRTVPVNASNLNRIMRLASESMIESRRLQSMQDSLNTLRDVQRDVSSLGDELSARDRGDVHRVARLDRLRQLNRRAQQLLQTHAKHLEQALWRSEQTSTALHHQVLGSRMRPFTEGTKAFPRMIRDLARSLGKEVSFQVQGGAVAVDRDILRQLEAPLNHILRNCVDHGLESPAERRSAGKPEKGHIVLQARHHAGMLTVQVRDDGKGIDPTKIRQRIVQRKLSDESMAAKMTDAELMEFLFLPGFSTAAQVTEVSGRGVGLDVVRTMVQGVSGTVRAESEVGAGTTFTLYLPVTLSVIRAALADIGGEPYAFPLSKLVRIIRLPVDQITPVQGRQQFMMDGQSVGLVKAAEVLDLDRNLAADSCDEHVCVIVIGQNDQPCGLAVDQFIGEQDLVVRPLARRLGKVPHILAAAATEAGEPLLIVDIEDLLQSVKQLLGEGRLRGMTSLSHEAAQTRSKVLVVDDSITVREVERQLLLGRGFDVDVAVDGQDGWNALCSGSYDLLVTDVDMPRMNGIELIRHARRDSRLAELPVIIVSYKDREEDRMLGFEAGANAYLTKGSFHDDSFVTTVADLIGEAS